MHLPEPAGAAAPRRGQGTFASLTFLKGSIGEDSFYLQVGDLEKPCWQRLSGGAAQTQCFQKSVHDPSGNIANIWGMHSSFPLLEQPTVDCNTTNFSTKMEVVHII